MHTTVPPAPETPNETVVHIKRSGTNERIDMYPGMVWRYEPRDPDTGAPEAIKHVHIGDQGLVFVQPGETDQVVYIGVSNKAGGNAGGNTDGKASGTTVVVNNSNGSNTGDNTGDKVMGETNVIVVVPTTSTTS